MLLSVRMYVCQAICLAMYLGMVSPVRAANGFDRDAITSGHVPASVKITGDHSSRLQLRVLREYAPCLKFSVNQPGEWSMRLGQWDVKPGNALQFGVSLAVPGQTIGKWATLQILNASEPTQVLAECSVTPGNWQTLKVSLNVPTTVQTVMVRLTGEHIGQLYLADAQLNPINEPLLPYLPQASTLDELLGKSKAMKRYPIQIVPGKHYGLYRPGDRITWQVKEPKNGHFQGISYKILDSLGSCLTTGQTIFGQQIVWNPPDVGYYELVVEARDTQQLQEYWHEVQGISVLAAPLDLPAGSTPFGVQCAPMPVCREMGASWIRQGLHRSWAEDVNQMLADPGYASWAQQTVADFQANHLMPVHTSNNITSKTNVKYPQFGEASLPADMLGYEQTYRELAQQGDGFVKTFAIWNEPHNSIRPTDWSVKDFARTLSAANRGMKQGNPKAKMILGHASWPVFQGVFDAGAGKDFDILAIHPYSWGIGTQWIGPEDGMVFEMCRTARQWLNEHDRPEVPVWTTEYGYCTGTVVDGCSELQQAQMLVRASLIQLAAGVEKLNPFRATDVWQWGQKDGRFGLLRIGSQTPKPSFVAFAVMARHIGALPFQGILQGPHQSAILVFGDEQRTLLAAWSPWQTQKISLVMPEKSTRFNLMGQASSLPAGNMNLELSPSVQYLLIPVGVAAAMGAQTIAFEPGIPEKLFDPVISRKSWDIPVQLTAPLVDGYLGDWQGPAIELDDQAAGVKSQMRVLVADDGLYLMARVRGRMPSHGMQPDDMLYQGNCVELYITRQAHQRPVGIYRASDRHLLFAPGKDGFTGRVNAIGKAGNERITGARVSYRPQAEGGYDLEAFVPLGSLGLAGIKPLDELGFDLQLDVCAPNQIRRQMQLTWSGNGQDYQSPVFWGNARLVAADASPLIPMRAHGSWPDAPNNLPAIIHRISPADGSLCLPMNTQAAAEDLYAMTGQFNENRKAWAQFDGRQLLIGGTQNWQNADAIWQFAAPQNNRFTAGTVTIRLSADSTGSRQFRIVTGTQLKLLGGGGYWKGLDGFEGQNLTQLMPELKAEPQDIQISIPPDCEQFFLAISKEKATGNPSGSRLIVHQITVKPQFKQTHGVRIDIQRREPLWTVDEQMRIRVVASTDLSGVLRWQLCRDDQVVLQNRCLLDQQSQAMVHLTGIGAGYYILKVSEEADGAPVLAHQALAVLARQPQGNGGIFGGRGIHPQDVDLLKRMGVSWIASTLPWAYVQDKPQGPINLHLQQLIDVLNDAGIQHILMLDSTPGWANDKQASVVPPSVEHEKDWIAFNRDVAKRLRGKVTWFEGWNEPNNPHALKSPQGINWSMLERMDVVKHLQALQYQGIKQGNPQAKLIGGAFAAVPGDWFKRWYESPSLLQSQDGMSAHPYPADHPGKPYHVTAAEPDLEPRLREARKIMDAGGGQSQPLFLTEYGWDTSKVDPKDNARWLARQMVIMQSLSNDLNIPAACLYLIQGHEYAILRPAYSVRLGEHRFQPAVAAFAQATAMMRQSQLIKTFAGHPDSVRTYLFKCGENNILTAWATEVSKIKSIPIPIAQGRTTLRMDVDGNARLQVFQPGQRLKLNGNDPVYWLWSDVPSLQWNEQRLCVQTDHMISDSFTTMLGNLGSEPVTVKLQSSATWLTCPSSVTIDPRKPADISFKINQQNVPRGNHEVRISFELNSNLTAQNLHISVFHP